jgi:pilus assembly protein Flp/PilA
MENMMRLSSGLLRRAEEQVVTGRVVSRLIGDRSGVTAIEYGLIAALIAVAAVVIMGTAGTNLSTVFSQVASSL